MMTNIRKKCFDKIVELQQLNKFDAKKYPSQINSPTLNIGKHNDVPDDQFDLNELAMGVEDEMEHTDDMFIAKAIAKDHLVNNPKYYSLLKQYRLD